MSKHVGDLPLDDLRAMRDVIDMLRLWRQRYGVTQKEMAARLDIAQPTLAVMESAEGVPTLSTLMRYARALDGKLTLTLEMPEAVN